MPLYATLAQNSIKESLRTTLNKFMVRSFFPFSLWEKDFYTSLDIITREVVS